MDRLPRKGDLLYWYETSFLVLTEPFKNDTQIIDLWEMKVWNMALRRHGDAAFTRQHLVIYRLASEIEPNG